MLDADNWMAELTGKLTAHFQTRLLFVGLQGSHRRDEAHEGSDIDVVVILDSLSIDDLIAYREIVLSMPESDKACGFVCGQLELMNWPKYDLFQLERDTQPCYGTMDGLLPDITDQDVVDSVKIGASALYHACCHTAVYAPSKSRSIMRMYKTAFFVLQAVYYLRSGVYVHSKKELLPLLQGDEQKILNISMNLHSNSSMISAEPYPYLDLMLRWLKMILDTQV